MMDPSPKLDKASWRRFVKGSDRCAVCGQPAAVSVTLTATELGGGQGAMLAREKATFCHDHGVLRFGDALRHLNGAVTVK